MMARPNKTLSDLHIDALAALVKHLAPEDMAAVAQVNKPLYLMMKGGNLQYVWRAKLIQHFPHHFAQLMQQTKVNWKDEFAKAYVSDYHNLPILADQLANKIKRIAPKKTKEFNWGKAFSWAKEGDAARLQQLNVKQPYGYLFKLFDAQNNSLLIYAINHSHQAVLDYCYQVALKKFSAALKRNIDAILESETGSRLIHFAFTCKQPLAVILALFERVRILDSKSNLVSDVAYTPLHIAIEYRRLDIVNALLASGVDADAEASRLSPLNLATLHDCFEITERLLAAGANVEGRAGGNHGPTPLMFASKKGNRRIVELLLKYNARILPDENDLNPLAYAARHGHVEIVDILLANGAEVNSASRSVFIHQHTNPLASAADGQHLAIANELIARGATIKDKETARNLLAMNANVPEVIYLYQEAATFMLAAQTMYLTMLHGFLIEEKLVNAYCNEYELGDYNPLYRAAKAEYQLILKERAEAKQNPILVSQFGCFAPDREQVEDYLKTGVEPVSKMRKLDSI
jgi:ankyrin repeat protein